MICLTLFLLHFAAVVTGTAKESEPYLIYAIEVEGKPITFWKTDYNIERKENILTSTGATSLATWYNNHYGHEDFLYASYKNSDVITKLNISSLVIKEVTIEGVKRGVFLGSSSDDKLYFYFPNKYKIRVYNFESKLLREKKMDGIVDTEAELVLAARDPIFTENSFVWFLECFENESVMKIFELDNNLVLFEFNMFMCPDKWTITPDGMSGYAQLGSDLYFLSNTSFEMVHSFTGNVKSLAAGIDEIFYTTDDYGKIFKLTKDEDGKFTKTEHSVDGKVTGLVI